MILEREPFLVELEDARTRAAASAGRVVLLSGEAGIGKTTVAELFVRQAAGREPALRVLWGTCDALFTPRPLGPLLDMAEGSDGPLGPAARSGADRDRLFRALLAELSEPGGRTIAVFEDVHWADEATLDLLKFVGRRIRQTSAIVLLSYRDDEVARDHPLRRVLGELPGDAVLRIRLPPLSRVAVERLAHGSGRDHAELHALTGGNPFYVTEVLAGEETEVPPSVRDAVLARSARLSADARAALDVVALVPGRTERWLLDAVLPTSSAAQEECEQSGILRSTAGALAFRHELARRVCEDAHDPGRAAALHARIVEALAGRDGARTMLARMVHHADRAGQPERVLSLAPAAAREAAALGAHREAAQHYETALRNAADRGPAERAALLDGWSYEVHLGGRMADAIRARTEALELWRCVGDRLREGDALRWLSRLAWFEGDRAAAAARAAEATAVLEPLGPSHELAMAYSTRAQLHILANQYEAAPEWGDRAVAMAEQLGDVDALAHALTNAACIDPGPERATQVRAVRLALEHGLHEHALRAYTWLVCDSIEERDYTLADRYLEEAIAYAAERDIDAFAFYLQGWRARMRLERGEWAAAAADATDVLRRDNVSSVVRIPSLVVLGTLQARRGEPGVGETLDEALERALPTAELQRLTPVAAARAEAAWLRGDNEAAAAEAMRVYPLALERGVTLHSAELACWLRRAGALAVMPARAAGPFALDAAGRSREAAAEWQRRGCPYERALALAEGDEGAQRESLAILDDLGASAAAAFVRRRLQERGVRGVRRGPRASTRANPAGLTNSQLRVLALLREGLSNQEIAARLFLSTRTVDHHVSAILRKLDARTRTEAASRAIQLGV